MTPSPALDAWQDILRCPIDAEVLLPHAGGWQCPACSFHSGIVQVKDRLIADFRARETPQTIHMTFTLPVAPLDRAAAAARWFHAPSQTFPHLGRRAIRRRFGTKLDKGMQYYLQALWRERGTAARILDLGCGSGGNRRYLHALGFTQVLTVDWHAAGADLLVDAHRLPLADASFDAVLSTAVFEHLYHPFRAMHEVGRVLRPGGWFVGSASFWEAWHGSSYFHLTPDGWHALLSSAGLTLVDLWQGWGIVPAALSHVLTPGRLRGVGYTLQGGIEAVYRLVLGRRGVQALWLRASGSYQVAARR